METIEIKDLEGELLFTYSCEDNTLKKTIEQAIDNSISLRGANLTGAYLRGANLTGAYLRGADLSGADLSGADLSGAILYKGNLRGANLSGADLNYAMLTNAEVYNVNLNGANLIRVDLTNVDLESDVLKSTDLSGIKADFYEVLDKAKPEIEGLKQALLEGRVEGTVYEGECACLVGTIANLKGVDYKEMNDLSCNIDRPIERWFLAIQEGHTPYNNPVSFVTVEWIEEYLQKESV
jgi:uncharacterized protein YjbI with pentapeptide repeats